MVWYMIASAHASNSSSLRAEAESDMLFRIGAITSKAKLLQAELRAVEDDKSELLALAQVRLLDPRPELLHSSATFIESSDPIENLNHIP